MSDGPKPYIDELHIDCNAEIKELKDEIALKHEMLKSLEQQCKEKDAEIERLKEENAMMTEQAVKFRDMVVENRHRDAEIERLKGENYHALYMEYVEKCQGQEFVINRQNALITELADALDWWAKHKDYDPEFAVELKKRAREATR